MENIPKADGKIGASMAFAFMFVDIPEGEKKMIVDKWGYKWEQETVMGYRRLDDKFFIPNIEMYKHEVHSVEAQKIIWEQIQNSNGETVVSTISFRDLFP